MDTIFLHGLKVDCVIGVWEWERRIIQTIIIDLDMAFDVQRAAKSDDISDTLSYRDVAKRVTAHVQPDWGQYATQGDVLRNEMLNQRRQGLFESLVRELREQYTVVTYEDVTASIIS